MLCVGCELFCLLYCIGGCRVVPRGVDNVYSMPVDLSFWGTPDKRGATIQKLRSHGYYMKETPCETMPLSQSSQSAANTGILSYETRRTALSASEVGLMIYRSYDWK